MRFTFVPWFYGQQAVEEKGEMVNYIKQQTQLISKSIWKPIGGERGDSEGRYKQKMKKKRFQPVSIYGMFEASNGRFKINLLSPIIILSITTN